MTMLSKLLRHTKGSITELIIMGNSRQGLRSLWGISLYSNAFYLTANSVVTAAFGLLFWIAAARFYSPQDVGIGSAAIAAASLLAIFSYLGLDVGLIRFLSNSGEKSRDLINSCLTITTVAAVILSLIFLFGLGIWSPALVLLRQSPASAGAFVAFTAAFTFFNIIGPLFIARRRAGFVLALGITYSLVRFVPLFLLATFSPSFGVFASWGIGIIVAIAIAVPFFLPRVEKGYHPFPAIKREVVNDIAHFSGANYAANLLMVAPTFIFPLMVINVLSAESTAYFYIAWSVAILLTSIGVGFSLSLLAEGSHDENRLSQDVRRSLKATLLVILGVIIIFVVGDKILLMFGSAYSQNATRLLWILALASLPVSINYIYFTIKRVRMEMKSVVAFSAFIAVFALMLSYFLLPRMGIMGVGVGWLAAHGIVALVTGRWMYAQFIRPAPRKEFSKETGI